jgi:hypothetical protein
MKISEIIQYPVVTGALLEDWMSEDLVSIVKEGGIILEMANLRPNITDLPANILLWTKPQPDELPHNKYRIKVTKDHKHVATYLISSEPRIVETLFRGKKYQLDSYEKGEIKKFIKAFYPLLLSFVDNKLNEVELEYEIQKRNKGE